MWHPPDELKSNFVFLKQMAEKKPELFWVNLSTVKLLFKPILFESLTYFVQEIIYHLETFTPLPVFSVYFNFNFCHQTTCKQAACDGWWCTENRFTIFRCLCGKFALSGERKKSYTFELLHIILWILLESSLYFHVPQYKYNKLL